VRFERPPSAAGAVEGGGRSSIVISSSLSSIVMADLVVHDLDQVTRSPVSLTRGSDGSIHSSSEDLRQSRHNLGVDQVNRQRGPSPRRPVELRLKTSLFLRRQQDDWPSIASPSPLAAAEHHHFFRNHAKKTKRHTQPTPRMSDYLRQEIASRILHALGFEKRPSTDPQNSDGKIDSTLGYQGPEAL
jgi:hypothetical protein